MKQNELVPAVLAALRHGWNARNIYTIFICVNIFMGAAHGPAFVRHDGVGRR
jgi:hypothetical protein